MSIYNDMENKVTQVEQALSSGKVVYVTGKKIKNIRITNSVRTKVVIIEFDDSTTRSFYISDFLRASVVIK
jgi:hypothetical protein